MAFAASINDDSVLASSFAASKDFDGFAKALI
jgi:hypothetical protein